MTVGTANGARAGVRGTLDRDAAMPLYFQLREALLREIGDRGLKPGDRMPTEAAIEQRYGVSRATIRQALAELAAQGLIRKVQGLGTFVAVPKIRHVPLLTSFSELVTSQGFVPSHRLLASTVQAAPDEVAGELGVEPGTACRYLRRLFLADDKVVGLADTWLPHDLVGAFDDLFDEEGLGSGSLYELVQRPPVDLDLDHAMETISPSVADAATAELLGCDPGSPVLVVKRVSFARDDRAVESTRLLFVGERYEYRVDLHRPSPAGGSARQGGRSEP
jgi:GntR family transcriptional regulator